MKIGKLYRVTRGLPQSGHDRFAGVFAFPMLDTHFGRYLEVDEVFMIVDEHRMVGRKDLHDIALIGEEVLLLSTGWDRAAMKVKTRS